jgi:hypothetical protein
MGGICVSFMQYPHLLSHHTQKMLKNSKFFSDYSLDFSSSGRTVSGYSMIRSSECTEEIFSPTKKRRSSSITPIITSVAQEIDNKTPTKESAPSPDSRPVRFLSR